MAASTPCHRDADASPVDSNGYGVVNATTSPGRTASLSVARLVTLDATTATGDREREAGTSLRTRFDGFSPTLEV
ncbi:hypothetical protein ACH40D_22275 [Streptomyces olivaceoviridis]|uniref:Uncharacterized protein n=1 Tax=Streptomyces olivaceoviridis TaxID=1921 RepID=A0ABW7VIX6_STROI|nr:hypothetical protein [Streptomyces corchorusii]